jgi:hypothetical protein
MSLIPLQLPAGVYRNGTEFESSNRWRDTHLVRWQDGSLRPVGGWVSRKTSAFAAPPRGIVTWADNSADSHISAGTYNKLYSLTESSIVSDITPVGLTSGDQNATKNLSYGGTFYGTGFFGTKRPNTGVYDEATTWSLDSWGEYLLACSSKDGKIYEWQLNTSVLPTALTNAPTQNSSMLVIEERFVFVLVASNNPRKVQWCDREDNTDWTPSATNEAGDMELQTTGRIMCGIPVRGRTLILTDNDAHIATYSGPPYVYGFEKVGTACGIASRKALVSIDEGAFWMGHRGFFTFDGSVAKEIKCDVLDYVFEDINYDQITKVSAVNNTQHGEIWWFYPSGSSIENDRYISLDYKEGVWSFGEIDRTACVDRGVFSTPIWADSSGNLYNHETGSVHGTLKPYAESGPISLGNGDGVMKVSQLIPDEKTQGEVNVTFKTRFHPNDTERTYGPYSTGNPTSLRFTGRQIRLRVEGTGTDDWRSGVMRIEARAGGKR